MNRRTNGAAIEALRKAVGIRQSALAAEAGVTQQYISLIERGVKQPDMQVVRKIADRLGVPMDSITYPAPEAEAVAS